MPTIKPGQRLQSQACDTQVMIIKGAGEIDLRCGGVDMTDIQASIQPSGCLESYDTGTLMGKRYVNADATLELLCTKPGQGSLSLETMLLTIKATQALPSSD